MLKELHGFSSAILIFAFFVYRSWFPFLRKCLAKKRRLPVLRSLVSVRIFPVQPSALGPGLRHQCWRGGWCCLAEMVCLKNFGTRYSNQLLFLWKKCGIVTANVAGKFLVLHEHVCSSARQSKRVGTRHFRIHIQVNLCKQEAGPGGLQKYRKANGQYILYAVNSPPARLS